MGCRQSKKGMKNRTLKPREVLGEAEKKRLQ